MVWAATVPAFRPLARLSCSFLVVCSPAIHQHNRLALTASPNHHCTDLGWETPCGGAEEKIRNGVARRESGSPEAAAGIGLGCRGRGGYFVWCGLQRCPHFSLEPASRVRSS